MSSPVAHLIVVEFPFYKLSISDVCVLVLFLLILYLLSVRTSRVVLRYTHVRPSYLNSVVLAPMLSVSLLSTESTAGKLG